MQGGAWAADAAAAAGTRVDLYATATFGSWRRTLWLAVAASQGAQPRCPVNRPWLPGSPLSRAIVTLRKGHGQQQPKGTASSSAALPLQGAMQPCKASWMHSMR